MSETMKIYQMNDCDWWIGPSLEACKNDYIDICGDPTACEDAEELSDEALDRMRCQDTDEDENPLEVRTFREQLAIEIAEGGTFPRMFASTEY